MISNQLFNVNGRLDRGGEKQLLAALKLAMEVTNKKVAAWRVSQKKGLILDWTERDGEGATFPVAMDAEGVFPMVLKWLNSAEASKIALDGWDTDYDHDGHNGPGWRVYCEDWGHVEGWQAIVAIKRVFVWYGK